MCPSWLAAPLRLRRPDLTAERERTADCSLEDSWNQVFQMLIGQRVYVQPLPWPGGKHLVNMLSSHEKRHGSFF